MLYIYFLLYLLPSVVCLSPTCPVTLITFMEMYLATASETISDRSSFLHDSVQRSKIFYFPPLTLGDFVRKLRRNRLDVNRDRLIYLFIY